jgi:hypothetical protein
LKILSHGSWSVLTRRTRGALIVAAGLVLALVGVLTAAAAGAQAPSAKVRFEFAVTPGTAAWAALPDHKAMEEATQIPRAEAQRMTTEELVDLVLRYPLFLDVLAFNSIQYGFETVASRFNGLIELLERPDAGKVLLARYQEMPITIPKDASLVEAGGHTYEVWKLETLLAQRRVLAHLSAEQLDELLRIGQEKFVAKQANEDFYGVAGLEPTAMLLGRGLATRQGVAWERSGVVADGISLGDSEPYAVLKSVRRYLNPGLGNELTTARPAVRSALDYYSWVYTPNGTAVEVIVVESELSSSQIAYLNQYVEQNYPNATRETNASRRYNCHSYAWYSQSTSNIRWMNQKTSTLYSPNLARYWNDGSYTFWHPPYALFSNMKLFWSEGDHSGIIVGTSNYVRSKWGQLPRMYHARNYSPYNMGSGPPPYVIGQGMNQFFR